MSRSWDDLAVYTSRLRRERPIYGFEPWSFPWGPMSYAQAGAFVGTFVFLVLVSLLVWVTTGFFLNPVAWFAVYFGVPWGAQKVVSLSPEQMDYRRPHEWLAVVLRYRLAAKRYAALQPERERVGVRRPLRMVVWQPLPDEREAAKSPEQWAEGLLRRQGWQPADLRGGNSR